MNWSSSWGDVWEAVADAPTAPTQTALQAHQTPPQPFGKGWVLLAGRGAGKSFAGMHWLDEQCQAQRGLRARVIAPTFGDGVASCVEGPNGLLVASGGKAVWRASEPGGACVHYPETGARVWIIGTNSPRDVDRLRALTNIEIDVFEEAFANPKLTQAWEQANLSRRRGNPRFVVTSTPRPHPLIAQWEADDAVTITRAHTMANEHLDPGWVETLERLYKGTRLYRQEVLGEVLEDVEGALWTQADLDRSRVPYDDAMAVCVKFFVGVDPASGSGTTGIIVCGASRDGHIYILEDCSITDGTPGQWGHAATAAARRYNAAIVVEVNQGGKMATDVLRQADPAAMITNVYAKAGKQSRAEPMALMFEADEQVCHLAGETPESLAKLEDQMLGWVPGEFSPDRIDAAAHAVNKLRLTAVGPPRVSSHATRSLGGW